MHLQFSDWAIIAASLLACLLPSLYFGRVQNGSMQDNIPLGLLGWCSGCTAIWSSLFTVGNFLYGRMQYASILLGIVLLSGAVLFRVVNKLWSADGHAQSSS